MRRPLIQKRLEAITDDLAAIEHERWSHWQQYLHGKGERQKNGSLILPAELVARWERQIDTPFSELSEAEKESDRQQVRKYLPLISETLSD